MEIWVRQHYNADEAEMQTYNEGPTFTALSRGFREGPTFENEKGPHACVHAARESD
jgi:hypothetical protein